MIHTCASQASTMILHYAMAHNVYYPGIADFTAHISLWAVERYLKNMITFKRMVRKWALVGYGFVRGAVQHNTKLVKKLLADGWFIKNPWLISGVMQLYFTTHSS